MDPRGSGAKGSRERLIWVLIAAGAVALVGAGFRVACVGHSCDEAEATADVPFCGLERTIRDQVVRGFRDGRSPDVLAVSSLPVSGGSGFTTGARPLWPQTTVAPRSPLVFWGRGVPSATELEAGLTLDRVAPTLAEIIELDRPHPEVRSGQPIAQITRSADGRPHLVVVVAVKGHDSETLDLQTMPALRRLVDEGASTMSAGPGSLPTDPTALLMTLGSGGLPFEHGITGTMVRNDDGELVRAWGKGSPIPVIAALGDDLDRAEDGASFIGLVGTDRGDRGLIGGTWYLSGDDDEVRIVAPEAVGRTARKLLADDVSATDDHTDLLGITLEGDITEIDTSLGILVGAAEKASEGSVTVVVTALGASDAGAIDAAEVGSHVEDEVGAPVVEATTPGGIFVDQEVLAERQITEDQILTALGSFGPTGTRIFEDVFTSIAVSFERYC